MLNVAHRGGEAYAPENTFAAFDNILRMDGVWVESDLRISKDGEVVLIHDDTVDRTTNGTGKVKDKTVEELKALDAGSWFSSQYDEERIPTLPEFFRRYRGRLKSMLEIKDAGLVEARLVMLIVADELYKETIIIGSNRPSLERVKSLDRRIEVGWTAHDPTEENVAAALSMGCHHIGIGPHLLTPDIVARINARGLAVRSTNVPDVAAMKHAVSCGVIGMTINFPEELAAHLKSLE